MGGGGQPTFLVPFLSLLLAVWSKAQRRLLKQKRRSALALDAVKGKCCEEPCSPPPHLTTILTFLTSSSRKNLLGFFFFRILDIYSSYILCNVVSIKMLSMTTLFWNHPAQTHLTCKWWCSKYILFLCTSLKILVCLSSCRDVAQTTSQPNSPAPQLFNL